jgi:hypothetical protein
VNLEDGDDDDSEWGGIAGFTVGDEEMDMDSDGNGDD